MKTVELACEQCGETFRVRAAATFNVSNGSPRRFCSRSCKGRASRQPWPLERTSLILYTCQECGTQWYDKPSLVQRKKYCSRSCLARGSVRKRETNRADQPPRAWPADKRCWRCKQTFLRTPEHFSRNRSTADGLQGECRICVKVVLAADYAANGDRRRAAMKAARAADPEKYRQRKREARERMTPDQRTRANQRVAEWHAAHPEATRDARQRAKAKRRAQMVGTATGPITAADIAGIWQTQIGRCFYCAAALDATYEIDHMTPLVRGGTHTLDNLAIACAARNRWKNRRTASEFRRLLAP